MMCTLRCIGMHGALAEDGLPSTWAAALISIIYHRLCLSITSRCGDRQLRAPVAIATNWLVVALSVRVCAAADDDWGLIVLPISLDSQRFILVYLGWFV